MKKIFSFITLVSLICFQLTAQKDMVLFDRINEVEEIPVYLFYQEINREGIDIQSLQTASHIQLTPEEISTANMVVKSMTFPYEFDVISDSIVAILNQRFETTKFVKAHLKNENFSNIGLIKWDFEKRPLFVFITINGKYELGGFDGASRKDDVDKSLFIKWKLFSGANIAFSHVNENGDYKEYANYGAVYYGPVFSVKGIHANVENIAIGYNPTRSIGPFSRKIDFFTIRFIEKQKRILAKKKN
jgi:hypothetical protein